VTGRLKITLRRSRIGSTPRQRAVLRGLGLRRINSNVVRPDDAAIRGMVAKVSHLVEVEEAPAADGSPEPGTRAAARVAESQDARKAAGGRSDETA